MFCVAVLLTSCGAARKAAEKEKEEAVPPHTPPVVYPHTWRETMQQEPQATISRGNVTEATDTTSISK